MRALPVTIAIGSKGSSRSDIGPIAQDVKITNSIPGGFGSFSCRVPTRDTSIVEHLMDIVVTGPRGDMLFEGRVEDVRPYYDGFDQGLEIEAYGYRRLLEFTPYRASLILRNIPWEPFPFSVNPALVDRAGSADAEIGQFDTADASKLGVALNIPTGRTIIANHYNGVWFRPRETLGIRAMLFTWEGNFRNAATTLIAYGALQSLDAAGAFTSEQLFQTDGAGGASHSQNFTTTQSYGVGLFFIVNTGGATTETHYWRLWNIRLLASRVAGTGTSTSEPVYGHEIIQDILSFCPDLTISRKDFIDTSGFSVPEAAWIDSVPAIQALDQITAMYDRHWAVWDNKTFHWLPNDFTEPQWLVRREEMSNLSLDRSVAETASAVRLRWQGADGGNFEQTVTDSRVDNAWKQVGATKIDLVDLGKSASGAAAQVGSMYFPDRSYPVVKGSVSVPLMAQVGSDRRKRAYQARAGEALVLPDAIQTRRASTGESYDRQTTFQIKSVEIDWDAQQVTMQFDNQRDRLSQVLARIQLDLSSRFGL